MTPDQIKVILAAHAQWLDDPITGQRADLTGAYLTGAYLRGADLTDANLTGAYLRGANLTDANLTDANLRGAIIVPGWHLVRV